MKPKHQRLVFVVISVCLLCISVLFVLRAFRDNLVFFYAPSEITEAEPDKLIRMGGLIETGSVVHEADQNVRFNITDGKATIQVEYTGLLPNLFREGQGAVVEGYVFETGHFRAKTVLTKHDENYMPKEVVDTLKRTGHWQEKTE